MIYENRYATIWPILCEPVLFLNVLSDVDALEDVFGLSVRLLQLFEDNGGFMT